MAWFQKKDERLSEYQEVQIVDQILAAQQDTSEQGYKNFDELTGTASIKMSDNQWKALGKKLFGEHW